MPRAVLPSGRKSLLIFILAAVVIGGAWWWLCSPPEPVHNGQRLSELLVEIGKPSGFATLDPIQPGAPRQEEAIRAFGPAAVPWLAYTVEHGRHLFVKEQPLLFDRAPDGLRRLVPERWGGLHASSSIDEPRAAALALRLLFRDAAPAIPALRRCLARDTQTKLEEDPQLDYIGEIACALQAMGPASWPAVVDALEHDSLRVRTVLVQSMTFRFDKSGIEPSAVEMAAILAVLTRACRDPDAQIRAAAAETFGWLRMMRPDLPLDAMAIPELVRLLSDPEPKVRAASVSMLSYAGSKAAPAIPRLIELLNDPDPPTRSQALRALGRVDGAEKRSAARLRTMLHDPDPNYRRSAAQALKALGISTVE